MSQPRNYYQEFKDRRARERAEGLTFELETVGGDLDAPLAEKPEDFQWTEDRERAIVELLESAVPGTQPAVARQIQAIRLALLEEQIAPERARALLDEVDAYLRDQLREEEGKAPVDDPDWMEGRSDKLNALCAWQEAASGIRQYLNNGEKVYLEVASYAGDQGSAFLSSARRLILQAEPEPAED